MASTSLAQRLYSLRLQDGRLDFEKRKTELDNLIHYLSGAEINHLVNILKQSTPRDDRFLDLPNEIILAIMDYLDIEDVVVARLVSQRWYLKWTEPEICFGIVERYFPDVLLRSYMSLPDDQKKGAKVALSKWASKRAVDVVKAQHGRCKSVSVCQREKSHLSPITPSEIQYCNGNVAEAVSSYEVVVKSLKTGESKTYMREDRAPILKWWLTDQLFITSNRHPHNTLTAWYLDRDETHTVRLTSRCLDLTAHGKYVGFQLKAEAFVWQVGGVLTNVKAPKVPASFRGLDWWPFHLLFHPINEDHYFLFYRAVNGKPAIFEIMVQEYIGNEPTSMYHSELATAVNGDSPIVMDGASLMSYYEKEVSRDGGEALELNQIISTRGPCGHARIYQDSFGLPLTVVDVLTFDMFTKTFSTRTYHIPCNIKTSPKMSVIWESLINRSRIWHNQLLLPAHITGSDKESKPFGIQDTLITAIKSCDRIQEAPNIIPWYIQDSSDKQRVLFLETDTEFQHCGVSFCWAAGGEFAEKTRLNIDPPGASNPRMETMVYGDDDFVVLLGENGYIVWSFGEQPPPLIK